ncbi:hypothetical protein LMH73_013870 [Vibrio splendidus]|nr:hypothetical protein [Vibrio splendidus]MCC4883061.1 hypothetical protein [Vibrio splendidus]
MSLVKLNPESEITADFVYVTSNETATSYSYIRRHEFLSAKETIALFKATIKIARTKGVKVQGQKKICDQLTELAMNTPLLIQQYNKLFDTVRDFWTSYTDMDSKTIPNYDNNVIEPIYDVRNKLMAMTYRNAPLGILMQLNSTIQEMNETVKELDSSNESLSYKF